MKILLIQHRAIGDVLMCTPAIRALRRELPEAEIVFLVSNPAYEALKHNPHIDDFLVSERGISDFQYLRFLMGVRKRKFDVVLDFQKNPRSTLAGFLSGARRRISFKGKRRNGFFTDLVDDPGVGTYACIKKLMLLRPLGIEAVDDFQPEFFVSQEDREWADDFWKRMVFSQDDFVAMVSPVSAKGKTYRQWGLDRYAKLCDFLMSEYGAKLVFNWGPNELDILKSMADQMDHIPDLDGEIPSICYLNAVLEKCSLFIGNDGGARHTAVAAGVPTVGIFFHAGISPHWTPPGDARHVVVQPETPGIDAVTLEDVVCATQRQIARIRQQSKNEVTP